MSGTNFVGAVPSARPRAASKMRKLTGEWTLRTLARVRGDTNAAGAEEEFSSLVEDDSGGGRKCGPSSHKTASWSLRRPLLTPSANA